MEKYTFEQIINERIREFYELMKETEKFSELVTYDEKYVGTNNYFFVDRNELALYYTYAYANKYIKKMNNLYFRMPWAIRGLDVALISYSKHFQHEYRDYNNNLIFTINNIEEFKEKFQSLANNPLVNELRNLYNRRELKISSLDGKTQLKLSNNYIFFEHNNFEIDFWNLYVWLVGDSLSAPQILEIFKESTFDSNSFSEYFAERVEMNKDKDLSIEISSDYNIIPYTIDKDEKKTREYFDIQKKEEIKKLVLTKVRVQ